MVAASPLSVWRGASGRRYVVVVYKLDQPDLVADYSAVVLAVRRDAEGQSSLVTSRACEPGDPGYLGWLAACAQRGAVELHAYRLAETAAERAAVSTDLAASMLNRGRRRRDDAPGV